MPEHNREYPDKSYHPGRRVDAAAYGEAHERAHPTGRMFGPGARKTPAHGAGYDKSGSSDA